MGTLSETNRSYVNKFFSAMSSPKPLRKKRKVLSIEDKLKVCNMVKQKVPKHIIMDTFNITRRTITGIANEESQLQEFEFVDDFNELDIEVSEDDVAAWF